MDPLRRTGNAASRYAHYSSDGYTERSSSRDNIFSHNDYSNPPLYDFTEETDSDIRNKTYTTNTKYAGLGQNERTSHESSVSKFYGSVQARAPTYHASVQGPWYSIFEYEACFRLCLNSRAMGCKEALIFLQNECLLLRNVFGLKNIMLQPKEELLARNSSELVNDGAVPKTNKVVGRLKVQVRSVRMSLDMPT